MKDPKRLRESEAGDFERLLLSSAADDQGSHEALRRVLNGIHAVSLVDAQPSYGVHRLRLVAHSGAVAKVAGTVVIATLLGVVGLHYRATTPRAAASRPAFKSSAPVARLPLPIVHLPDQPVVEAPVAKATVNAPTKRKRAAPLPATPAPQPHDVVASTRAGLPIGPTESQLLDEALGLLRAHELQASLARLDRYEHDFPQGTLCVEAALLKARALVLAGERERAAAFASSFLATHAIDPKSMSGRELRAFCNKP